MSDLWIRIGDGDEYDSPEFVWEVGDRLFHAGIREFEVRTGGCEAEGFRRNNYVSVYWGDDEGNRLYDLTPAQWDEVRRRIATLANDRRRTAAPVTYWVRAGVGDSAVPRASLREVAERVRARGFDDPRSRFERSAASGAKFRVGPYPELTRPVWVYVGRGTKPDMVRYLSDDELDRLQSELSFLNNPVEDRVNAGIQNLASALLTFGVTPEVVAAGMEGDVPQVRKRCFEFRHSGSDKFWTIEVVGTTAFVTYGKIGSSGATQVKTFRSATETSAFRDKMVREKTGKGYTEVASTKYPGAPAQQLAALTGPAPAAAPPPPPPAPVRPGEPEEGDRNIEI